MDFGLLTLTLGPAVAKAILRVWLKDNSVLQDVSSSLVDLLKNKGLDVQAQQRGKRQFEEIGEKVAESLLPLFEESGIPEDDKEAVAIAVAETISKAKIDAAVLAEKNLD